MRGETDENKYARAAAPPPLSDECRGRVFDQGGHDLHADEAHGEVGHYVVIPLRGDQ